VRGAPPLECAAMDHEESHLKGIVLVLLGVVLLSPDALLLRLISADHWTLLFWRGTLSALSLVTITLLLERPRGWQRFFSIGRSGALVAVIFAMGSVCFVFAILHTTVANALVIMSVSPLFAAILSHFFFGEAIPLRTWLAALAIIAGLVLVFAGSLSGDGLAGDLAALGVSVGLAINFVIIRKQKAVSMVPAMAWSGVIVALAVLPLAAPASLSGQSMHLMLLLGLVVVPVSLTLITLGPRYIPAPEAGLIMRLEALLAPLWVWLVLGEVPTMQTLLGGTIIIGTLVLLSVAALKGSTQAAT